MIPALPLLSRTGDVPLQASVRPAMPDQVFAAVFVGMAPMAQSSSEMPGIAAQHPGLDDSADTRDEHSESEQPDRLATDAAGPGPGEVEGGVDVMVLSGEGPDTAFPAHAVDAARQGGHTGFEAVLYSAGGSDGGSKGSAPVAPVPSDTVGPGSAKTADGPAAIMPQGRFKPVAEAAPSAGAPAPAVTPALSGDPATSLRPAMGLGHAVPGPFGQGFATRGADAALARGDESIRSGSRGLSNHGASVVAPVSHAAWLPGSTAAASPVQGASPGGRADVPMHLPTAPSDVGLHGSLPLVSASSAASANAAVPTAWAVPMPSSEGDTAVQAPGAIRNGEAAAAMRSASPGIAAQTGTLASGPQAPDVRPVSRIVDSGAGLRPEGQERPAMSERAPVPADRVANVRAILPGSEAPHPPTKPLASPEARSQARHAPELGDRRTVSEAANRDAAGPGGAAMSKATPVAMPPRLLGAISQKTAAGAADIVVQPGGGEPVTAPGHVPEMRPDALQRPGAPALHAPPQGAEVVRQAMAQMADRAPVAPGSYELSLSPGELGRVRIVLTPGDGGVAVQITGDRPETLDLLRRHADLLSQDFRAMGFGETRFDFGDRPGGTAQGRDRQDMARAAGSETEALDPASSDRTGTAPVPSDGLDLRL